MRIKASLASHPARRNPGETRLNDAGGSDRARRNFTAKRCSYHLRAIPPRFSCVAIRRGFILFAAAQSFLFVNSPLPSYAA